MNKLREDLYHKITVAVTALLVSCFARRNKDGCLSTGITILSCPSCRNTWARCTYWMTRVSFARRADIRLRRRVKC